MLRAVSNQSVAVSGGIDRYFKITERGSTVGREIRGGVVTFFTMAYIIVLNPIILSGRGRRRRQAPRWGGRVRRDRRRHGARGRRPDDPDGRRRQLPAGARDRSRPQRLRGLLGRQPDDLGRRDGPGGDRGPGHPGAGPHRLPGGGLPRRARAAEGRDLGRHRPLHRAHRLRRRRVRAPDPRRCGHDRPRPARADRAALRVAGARLRLRTAAGHRSVGASRQGRDPDLDRGDHGARDHRRVDRRPRLERRQPEGLGAQRPGAARQGLRHPALRHPRRVQPARVLGPGRRRHLAAADLHADAGGLLRHHGHDDGDRRRGRACSRRTARRPTPAGSWSSTRSPRPPAARPASRPTRPTSSRPPASETAPGPASRRW